MTTLISCGCDVDVNAITLCKECYEKYYYTKTVNHKGVKYEG